MDSLAQPLRIAIAANFSAEAIRPSLAFWMDELDTPARFEFAAYDQLFQELLDPASMLSANTQGFNVVLLRLDDWLVADAPAEHGDCADPGPDLGRKVVDFVASLAAAVERSGVSWLLVACPPSPELSTDMRRAALIVEMEKLLVAGLAGVSGIDVVTSSELAIAYPVAAYFDAHADSIAHMPYTRQFFAALATMVARRIHGRLQPVCKAVVVDCDNTLWTGVCGEDGPGGVFVDPGRQRIHDYLSRLHDDGVLLCLCSRNNETDVRAVFQQRPEMHLALDAFAAFRSNWKPKSENIASIAAELDIAPGAIAFFDDDPVECAEVAAHCPEVLTFQLPRDSRAAARFMSNLWLFDGRKPTAEGRARTTYYRQNAARARARRDAPTLRQFLAHLDLAIEIVDALPANVPRLSELTRRTNQFNLTTIRRSEAEIDALIRSPRESLRASPPRGQALWDGPAALVGSPRESLRASPPRGQALWDGPAALIRGIECLVVSVKDRFGDYGIVGFLCFAAESEALAIDTFLLSCRALGRGVEHRMLARLGEIARQRGLPRVDLPFRQTPANQPARDFLRSVAADFEATQDGAIVFRVPADIASTTQYRPSEHGATTQPTHPRNDSPESAPTDARARAALLTAIANELSDPALVLKAVAARTRARPDTGNEYVAPRNSTERTIAEILGELLGIDRIGVEDNFFQMGGHSLLAMQVLFRIREAFGVELSAKDLYDGDFTPAQLATKVVNPQLPADPGRIDVLIAKLDRLSGQEIRTLLDEEPGTYGGLAER